MSGWTRLKIVLSALYWLGAAWVARMGSMGEADAAQQFALFLAVMAVPYAVLASLWWAIAGFGRRS